MSNELLHPPAPKETLKRKPRRVPIVAAAGLLATNLAGCGLLGNGSGEQTTAAPVPKPLSLRDVTEKLLPLPSPENGTKSSGRSTETMTPQEISVGFAVGKDFSTADKIRDFYADPERNTTGKGVHFRDWHGWENVKTSAVV